MSTQPDLGTTAFPLVSMSWAPGMLGFLRDTSRELRPDMATLLSYSVLPFFLLANVGSVLRQRYLP